MKRQRSRFLILLLVVSGLSLLLLLSYRPKGNMSPSDILGDFIGDYSYSNGFVNQWLSIKPDRTFTVTGRTDAGEASEHRGTFSISSEEITLIPVEGDSWELNDLILVKWGGRR